MTTRRSFLKRLAVTAAGFAAGANLLTDRATAKAPIVRATFDGSAPTASSPEINPEWLNAPYEVEFLFGKNAFMRSVGYSA